jgi:Putative transmembrane protein (PGPGW)
LRLFGAARSLCRAIGIISDGRRRNEPTPSSVGAADGTGMHDRNHSTSVSGRSHLRIFGRHIALPRSRLLRVLLGVLLVIFGILGFLPVLGFWMIPLGLLILSYEFHIVRRLRRRTIVWWEKRRRAKDGR